MLQNIVKEEIIFFVMGILLAIGVVAKLISTFTVRRMVKAAGEIQKSNHKLIRLIKAKFEHASMISDKVQNVEAFVDKYLYEYKVFGVKIHTWRTLPKKMLIIIGILGVFAVFESYRMEGFGELSLKYMQWTGIFVLLLALLHFVAEEQSQLQAARNYMVDYLENVCVYRYMKMHKGVEESEEKEEEIVEDVEEETEEIQTEKKKSEQEMRIRAILEEFLA